MPPFLILIPLTGTQQKDIIMKFLCCVDKAELVIAGKVGGDEGGVCACVKKQPMDHFTEAEG